MKKYFSQLRPLERRLVVGVGVVLFIVLNWVFVKPHFADWGEWHGRRADADRKLESYQRVIAQKPELNRLVKNFESEGEFIAAEDVSVNFIRTIQTQALQSGVQIQNTSRQITHTNDAFFVEQVQNINVLATDPQLIDFLYKLGSGVSMIRVRDLELQPDAPRMHLAANIKLVASYQKNPKPAVPAASSAKVSNVKAK